MTKPIVDKKRSLIKTITWKIVSSIVGLIIAWATTGELGTVIAWGSIDIIFKFGLYYGHERLWYRFGIANDRLRHILKALAWRIIATGGSILGLWLFTGDIEPALQFGAIDVVAKLILYYLHERAWFRVKYGVHKEKD